LDIKLWLEGERLRFSNSEGVMSPELREEINRRTSEIVSFLHSIRASSSAVPPPLVKIPREGALPLSFAQQRLWFIDQLEPGNVAYNIFHGFRVSGDLNPATLQQVLSEIVRRHEVVRTTFSTLDGAPMAHINPATALALPLFDLTGLSDDEQEKELRRLAYEEINRPFDLAKDTLLRVRLVRLRNEENAVFLSMHHIASDLWSTSILINELSPLYDAFSMGKTSPLPEIKFQYVDFAHWQRQWLNGELLQTQVEYWQRQLAGPLTPLDLPTDRPRTQRASFTTSIYPFTLSSDLTASLRALSRQGDTTLFTFLVAAFIVLLHKYTRQEDIIIGTQVAGRKHVDTERLIGFFVNMLILRTKVSGSYTFRELLTRVHDVVLDALDNQDLPFERLVEELQLDRQQSRLSIGQVLFGFQSTAGEAPIKSSSNLKLKSLGVRREKGRADLVVLMWEEGDSLAGSFEYNTDLYDESSIAQMSDYFITLLQGVSVNPNQQVIMLPPLPGQLLPVRASSVSHADPMEDLYQRSNLTMNQLLFWIGQKMQPKSPLFNMALYFLIRREINTSHFQEAFQYMVDSCDSLRTVLGEIDGVPYQRQLGSIPYEMEVLDFSESHDPFAQLNAWVQQRAQCNFDLKSRLFDSALIKLRQQEFAWYLNQHHLIMDGWSVSLTVDRMVELYELAAKKMLATAPQYPAFADYVKQERDYRSSSRYKQGREYWNQKLVTDAEPVQFYGERRQMLTSRVERLRHELPVSVGRQIIEVAKSESFSAVSPNASMSNIFLGLLCTYLYRISGNRFLSLGIAIHNRRTAKLRETIGLFVEFIPFQIEMEPADTFPALVQKIDTELMASLRYCGYGTTCSMQYQTFDAVFNYVTARYHDFLGAEVESFWVHNGHGAENMALHIHDLGSSGELTIDLDLHHDIFDEQRRQEAFRHFLQVLESFLEGNNRPINTFDILTEGEKHQLLVELNKTKRAFPDAASFAELFAAQAEKTPDRIAVVSESTAMTYALLDFLSGRVSRHIRAGGGGPEKIVAIFANRGIEFLVSMLGVFKAGAAYLPLDPLSPKQRICDALAQSKSSIILVGSELAMDASEVFTDLYEYVETVAPDEYTRVLTIEELRKTEPEMEGLTTQALARNLAYVIFTSGSTGRPKGAMVEQRGMINHIYAKLADLTLLETDVVAQTANQCFDISVWQFLAPLLVGGRVHIVNDSIVRAPKLLLELLERESITVFETVPSLMQAMLREIERLANNLPRLEAMRWMVVTGEALRPNLCRQWLAAYPGTPLLNAYGPTECSDDVTHCIIKQPPSAEEQDVPIGRAIANTRLYVLDEAMMPVPTGVPGELYVGGVGVGRGYLGKPELTSASFVCDPFSGETGSRLYRTGDVVRYRRDRELEFLGRCDYQVKIRGFRIEMGEIESELHKHSGVKDAVVVAWESETGEKRLIAYVVPTAGEEITGSDLREHLQRSLADYMVPSAFVTVDEIPLTVNGKVDRKALLGVGDKIDQKRLLQLALEQESKTKEFIPPRNILEGQLAVLWEEVLEVRPIGVRDSFFDIGGHSLLAVRLMSRIQQWFGQDLPLSVLFQCPTIEQLARVMSEQFDSDSASPLVALQPNGSKRPFFCVHPATGNIFGYIRLAHHLGIDRPFFGLQDPKLFGEGSVDAAIADIASSYIKAIREVQPEGPYLLGGWSFGGLAAFEMAQQLRKQGQQTALLVIIDASSPVHQLRRFTSADAAQILSILAMEMAPGTATDSRSLVENLRRLPARELQVKYVVDYVKEHNDSLVIPSYADKYLQRCLELFESRIKAGKQYMPQLYLGPITLLRADERILQIEGEAADATLGWQELSAEPVKVHVVPGNHATLVREPHVESLARQLTLLMEAADHSSTSFSGS
jgi:amino acid adenylation domain-containing protein